MSLAVKVRPCAREDVEFYARMNLDFMRATLEEHPYWDQLRLPTQEEMEGVIRAALEMPEALYMLVIEQEGRPVGIANAGFYLSLFTRGKALLIDDLYIDPALRGQGIGKAAVAALFEYARENGFLRVQLLCEKDNARAIHLYEKSGFEGQEMLFFMKLLRD